MLDQTEKNLLARNACQIRQGIINSTHAAKSGHPGGSLGAADIFTMLYFKVLRNIDPKNPKNPERDCFVLSKGHTAPGLYSTLASRGFFSVEELTTLRQVGSHLQGHPSIKDTPGVDMSTGSLGQGVSAAVGMALGFKTQQRTNRVYTLLGDGEIAEGQCWEAFMAAAHFKLDNLCVIIDLNGLQIDGRTIDVMDSRPVDKKMQAFNFEVISVDGHNFDQLNTAFEKAAETKGRPTCILATTTKGKGVSFMEDKASWHGKAPSDDEACDALKELAELYGEELAEMEVQ